MANWRSRRKGARYYAKCSCGRTYNRAQWKALRSLGIMHFDADEIGPESNIEMKNCVCGSTMAVEKGPGVERDTRNRYYATVTYLSRSGEKRQMVMFIYADSSQMARKRSREVFESDPRFKTARFIRVNVTKASTQEMPHSPSYRARREARPAWSKQRFGRDRSHEKPGLTPGQVTRAIESARATIVLARSAAARGERKKATVLLNSAERVITANFEDAAHFVNCGRCMPNGYESRALYKLLRETVGLFHRTVHIRERGRREKMARRRRRS